jgi:parvulin-like peptidyl-prolyl isomerase
VIRSQYGYHIIKLTAVKTWDDIDKPQLKRLLIEQKRNEAFEKYMAQIRGQSKVTVNEVLLK